MSVTTPGSKKARPWALIGISIVVLAGIALAAMKMGSSLGAAKRQKGDAGLNAQGASGAGSLLQSPSNARGQHDLQATGAGAGQSLLNDINVQRGGVLSAQGSASGNSLQSPNQMEKVEMPRDVREWLEHLRITDQKKVDLASTQISEAMVLMVQAQGGDAYSGIEALLGDDTGKPPETESPTQKRVTESTASMRQKWITLIQFFNSKPPPQECVPIRDNYLNAIAGTGDMILEILNVMSTSAGDPSSAITKLQAMRGSSTKRVNEPTERADQGVSAICSKYQTPKWFQLQSEVGSGSILGKSGF